MAVVLKRPKPIARPAQGDIYKDVAIPFVEKLITSADGGAERIDGGYILYEYIVVLSQECDLDQDYKERSTKAEDQDKHLQALLCAPAYLAMKLRVGLHLDMLNLKMKKSERPRSKLRSIKGKKAKTTALGVVFYSLC